MEYRDSASYCQGMNYVMGFFLLSFENEEFAYRCFAQLLEKVQMPIFTDNFTHLQSNFYVLDRMLSVYIPDLYEHLKVRSFQEGRKDHACVLCFRMVHHPLLQFTTIHS